MTLYKTDKTIELCEQDLRRISSVETYSIFGSEIQTFIDDKIFWMKEYQKVIDELMKLKGKPNDNN